VLLTGFRAQGRAGHELKPKTSGDAALLRPTGTAVLCWGRGRTADLLLGVLPVKRSFGRKFQRYDGQGLSTNDTGRAAGPRVAPGVGRGGNLMKRGPEMASAQARGRRCCARAFALG